MSLAALLLAALNMTGQVNISIDASQRGPKISPVHYGIFFEDINHAADGGLYAELIRNRSLEDNDNECEAWSVSGRNAGNASVELTDVCPLNGANKYSMLVKVQNADDKNMAGVTNTGFWGINAVKGTTYKLSFWARSDKKFKGSLKAMLRTDDKYKLSLGEVSIPVKLNEKWKKYMATITATGTNSKAVFDILSNKTGEFQLDMVSLFPPTYKNRENGMRKDLAEMLEAMHPKFMRFPGGCFVEGQNSPDNAFRWERTIGPVEERPGHKNVNWGYRTTDGIGFHEYLQLAEDLGAKPLYVVNVGIWHGGYTPLDSLQSWIDECMNALEYANGPVTSKYGALRAKNGHPEPFNIEYLEIGNENYNFFINSNQDQSINYPDRYKIFYDAIKSKYPNMHCIGNVEAWGTDSPSWRNDYPVEMVDEHYYRNPKWFAQRFNMYDSYDRSKYKVYVGEYAVTSQFGKVGNLNAALGEAVYMMGMENNSDVTVMNSYAPIFVNENNVAWAPDMIRFNSSDCMGTPSYYVQMLFPNNVGTQVVKTSWTQNLPEAPATKEELAPAHVGLATWNTVATYYDAEYFVDGKSVPLSDFTKWNVERGTWNISADSITQSGHDEPAVIYCPDVVAKKYTYKVKARKREGKEGFLLVFGYKDKDNYNWFNVGGWSNSQNNIEQANDGGRIQLCGGNSAKVDDDREYQLQVDVDGDSVSCLIDGKLEMTGKRQYSKMKGVFASTTIDDAAKVMYVKVVNTGYGPTSGSIDLKNAVADKASVIRLSSESGDDENTLLNPKRIQPVNESALVTDNGSKILFSLPSYSVNIVRVNLK